MAKIVCVFATLMAYISGCEILDQFREREHRDQDQHQSGSEQVE